MLLTVQQATAKALSLVGSTVDPDGSSWSNECCHACAIYYGKSSSGYVTAQAHWNAIPSQYKHAGTPPVGSSIFFGNSGAGHEMFSFGDGTAISNDIVKAGRLDRVAWSLPISKWGMKYLGWTDVYYSGEVILIGADMATPLTQADVNKIWAMPIQRRNPDGTILTRTALQELADAVTLGLEFRTREPIIDALAGEQVVQTVLTDSQVNAIADAVFAKIQSKLAP